MSLASSTHTTLRFQLSSSLMSLLSALVLLGGEALAQTTTDPNTTTTSGATIFVSNTNSTDPTLGGSILTLNNSASILNLNGIGLTQSAGAIVFNGSTAVTDPNTDPTTAANLVLSGAITNNASITVNNSNSLTLSGASTNIGATRILNVGSNALTTLGGTVSGSTISLNSSSLNGLTLNGVTAYIDPTTTITGAALSLASNGAQYLSSSNTYTGTMTVNGASILTNGNALGTISASTLTLAGGGVFNLTGLSSSGITLVLGQTGTSGTTISLTASSASVGGTTRVTTLGSVPVGNTPASATFTTPAVALLGVGSVGGQTVSERGVLYAVSTTNSTPTLGGTGVVKVVHTGLMEPSGSFSLTAAGLAANTTYAYRVYAVDSTGVTYLSTTSTFTTPTVLQNWRQTFFGSTQSAGAGADNADPDGDGVANLLEFATGKNPTSSNTASDAVSHTGSILEYTYTRSLDALSAGATFTVEWNDTLDPAQWSSSGVTEVILSDNGLVQQVKAAVPASSTGRRFMRLKVLPPAQ